MRTVWVFWMLIFVYISIVYYFKKIVWQMVALVIGEELFSLRFFSYLFFTFVVPTQLPKWNVLFSVINWFEQALLSNVQATRYATSSAAAVRSSSAGLFSWLTGERSSSLPPLDTVLEGVSLPPALPDYVEPGKVKVTTLDNGVRIASVTSNVCAGCRHFFMLCFVQLLIAIWKSFTVLLFSCLPYLMSFVCLVN